MVVLASLWADVAGKQDVIVRQLYGEARMTMGRNYAIACLMTSSGRMLLVNVN